MFITEIINIFNIQMFAEAGTLVNATGNYVNAYDGIRFCTPWVSRVPRMMW